MTHPYADLIAIEAKRAEDDLASMRTRVLSIITTTTGIVTLLAVVTTFAASKDEVDRGVPTRVVVLLGIALGLFVVAAVLALAINFPQYIDRPKGDDLKAMTERAKWYEVDAQGQPDTPDQERVVAAVQTAYLVSVRALVGRSAWELLGSIVALVLGLGFAVVAVLVLLNSY